MDYITIGQCMRVVAEISATQRIVAYVSHPCKKEVGMPWKTVTRMERLILYGSWACAILC